MISVEHLDFFYQKGRPIFSDLNLKLSPGHIYGLLGKNGSGKSTLLKCICGLAFPVSGTCTLNGVDTSRRTVSTLQDLFFLPEEVYVPALTPGQFLNRTAGFYPNFREADFYSHLQVLDVDRTLPMHKMSFGQQKKVMIAFGLASNTPVLILDEPTNGLDIPSKIQFRKLLASAFDEDRCMVISTHQVRDLDSLIDTVLILDKHRIVVNSSVDLLTDRLLFGLYNDTSGMQVLYEEETMRGKLAVLENGSGKYSKMDLELLFNAVIANGDRVAAILQEGGSNE